MCGICGYSSNKSLGKEILRKMNNKIAYRGPDAEGYYIDTQENREIGLAHRRLSILDLSSLGNQPMISNDGEIIVVFNGEIYNYIELKEELQSKGYIFNSNSDTEVIINGYLEYGIEVVEKLNGMFAIALYDKKSDVMYLIRDHLGVKPLYYYINEKNLVFASELKPIMEVPFFKKEIDYDSLNNYLYYGYITGEKSIFKNVYKLLPGNYLKLKDNKIEIKEYWSIEKTYLNRKIQDNSLENWKKIIKDHLEKSIKERMISDVPIGAFLSGGIDSSLVVAIMQSLSKNPIKTFTIGFENKLYNEAGYAKLVAEHLGTDHTEYYLKDSEVGELIENIPQYYDEPFADSSQIPTMIVSKLAKEQVTVSLSGDGGDELFCGYSSYERYLKLSKYIEIFKMFQWLPFKERIAKKVSSKYTHLLKFNSEDNIINAGYLSYIAKESFLKRWNRINKEERYFKLNYLTKNIQEKAMLRDLITYLPDDILTKVDRASMAYSLESRAPFVDDHKFVELSFNIPHSLKYKNNEKKYILKEILSDYVPRELIERPKKGFAIPIEEMLRTNLKYLLEMYLNEEFIKKQNIFNKIKIKECLRLFYARKNIEYQGIYINKLVWHLLIFQMWYKKYIMEI